MADVITFPKGTRFVPLVDGFLLNRDTGAINKVQGFIKIDPKVVVGTLDRGATFVPIPINEVFFHTFSEAAVYLAKHYAAIVNDMTQRINKLNKEVEKEGISKNLVTGL